MKENRETPFQKVLSVRLYTGSFEKHLKVEGIITAELSDVVSRTTFYCPLNAVIKQLEHLGGTLRH